MNELINLMQMVALILAFTAGMGALLGLAAALIEGVIALNEWHSDRMYKRRQAKRYVSKRPACLYGNGKSKNRSKP